MSQTATRESRLHGSVSSSVIESSYGTCHVQCGCGYVALDIPDQRVAQGVARQHAAATGHPYGAPDERFA